MTLTLRADVAGGAILKEGNVEAIKVDGSGNVTFPAGLLKQPLARRQYCSVHASANVAVTPNVVTKVTALNTVNEDPANLFDAVNKRYKPTVAGLYEVKASIVLGSTSFVEGNLQIFKTGAVHKILGDLAASSAIVAQYAVGGSCFVRMNGTTDYLEAWYYCTGATANVLGGANGASTWLQAILIEAD